MSAQEIVKDTLKILPDLPGVYKYYDKSNELIYVGKAKNLKKRVTSYFANKADLNRKTQRLVAAIVRIEFTIVNSEYEAYLLENNLIKENKPRYNILLKDDKTFPYMCITSERFPRIISTRRKDTAGEYFGPYPNVRMMNSVYEFIREMYPVRNCTLNLSEENIKAKKYKVCLEYHLGKCKGPCEGLQEENEYQEYIVNIKNILNGRLAPLRNSLKEQMMGHAEKYEFEKAQVLKEKLQSLENYQSKSTIVNDIKSDLEVYTIRSDEKTAIINYLKLLNGTVVETQNIEVQKKLEESDSELLTTIIISLRNEKTNNLNEIICNVPLELDIPEVEWNIPRIGDKKRLIEISLKNCTTALLAKQEMRVNRKVPLSLLELKEKLRLKELPIHIECFDNSNFQGSEPVSAMVCFKYGKPSNKDYRHFNIKTVEGPNDFDSMKEVVYRRYRRMLDEKQTLPQLIVIDGGKGQLSSAVEVLKELGIWGQIAIIGIAKRLEEIYTPGDELPLYIDKKSQALYLIQHMRNEAHRFGITHHRSKRTKKEIKISILDIKGIGQGTADKLLKEYKSINNIIAAGEEEVSKLIGASYSRILFESLNKKEAS